MRGSLLSPKGPVCVVGRLGRGKQERARGTMGRDDRTPRRRVGEGHAQFRMLRRLKCTKNAGSEHAPRENLNLLQLSSSSEMDRNTSKTVIL